MAITYPTSLDALSNPSGSDTLDNATTPHATQHGNANDAIEALETKLGTGSGAPTQGALFRGTAAGASGYLTKGTAGQFLRMNSGATDPEWFTPKRFSYFLTAAVTNQTGDATVYTILPDGAILSSTDYATGTGIYTVPANEGGLWLFSANLTLLSLGAAHTSTTMTLVTTSKTHYFQQINPGAVRDSGNSLIMGGSILVSMAAGDTAKVQVVVSGSTKTVGINGNASIPVTMFAGLRLL